MANRYKASAAKRRVDEFDPIAFGNPERLEFIPIYEAAVDFDYDRWVIFVEPIQKFLNGQFAPIHFLWKAIEN
jgi:hypothetical protein